MFARRWMMAEWRGGHWATTRERVREELMRCKEGSVVVPAGAAEEDREARRSVAAARKAGLRRSNTRTQDFTGLWPTLAAVWEGRDQWELAEPTTDGSESVVPTTSDERPAEEGDGWVPGNPTASGAPLWLLTSMGSEDGVVKWAHNKPWFMHREEGRWG